MSFSPQAQLVHTSAAQLCDGDSLSVVLSFLSTRLFMLASRTCHQWRYAGRKRSAWPTFALGRWARALREGEEPTMRGIDSRILRLKLSTAQHAEQLSALADCPVLAHAQQLNLHRLMAGAIMSDPDAPHTRVRLDDGTLLRCGAPPGSLCIAPGQLLPKQGGYTRGVRATR
jgi:hypothetical protein